jgi:predicted RNA-binding protein with PIN domain
MPYLVDGHNLIPHLPGVSLGDLEDEQALIHLLQSFATQQRTRIEVFFDQAPPSWARSQSFGTVKAHFIRQGSTADRAIISRLQKIGKEAKNWTVVTSDREILAEAKSIASKTLPSSVFAGMIFQQGNIDQSTGGKGEAPEVSPEEVNYWLNQFEQD